MTLEEVLRLRFAAPLSRTFGISFETQYRIEKERFSRYWLLYHL
jgi:hypothetical protein